MDVRLEEFSLYFYLPKGTGLGVQGISVNNTQYSFHKQRKTLVRNDTTIKEEHNERLTGT